MAQKTFREEYESIGTFLVLEILALVSFGLGGVSLIFQYAGFIVALIATFFAFKNYSKDDLIPVLCLGAPLLLLSILQASDIPSQMAISSQNSVVFLVLSHFWQLVYQQEE